MNLQIRKRLQFFGLAGALCIIGLIIAYRAWDRHEMLQTTLNWGRLAPLPAGAKNLMIEKEGSMLSRSFRVSFTAPATEVQSWLHESSGTRDVTPERHSPENQWFLISPGNGAGHAAVIVDDSSGTVRIYVSWS